MYRSRSHYKSDMMDFHLGHSASIFGRGPGNCLMNLPMISIQYCSLAGLDVAPIAQKSMIEARWKIRSCQSATASSWMIPFYQER